MNTVRNPPPPPPPSNDLNLRNKRGTLWRRVAAATVAVATVCLAPMAPSQTTKTGPATSSIYTGQAGDTWNHTFFWPHGIERMYATGTNGLADLNFRATLTLIAGRTTEKIVCKRHIEDPKVKALGGSAMIWKFVDYDPENGVMCEPSERLKVTTETPTLGPKNCTTTGTSIDCRDLNAANLPDEVSYRVAFPNNVADDRVVVLYVKLKGETAPRQIRYVAGGCNWLTCP